MRAQAKETLRRLADALPGLAAAALLVYAYRLWSALRKEKQEEAQEETHADEHDIKS